MGKKFIVRGDIPKEPALTIKNQPILTPGKYYDVPVTEEDIQQFVNLTDWNDPYNSSLIYGHKTNTSTKWLGNPSPEDWVGNYKVQYKKEGVPKPGAYSDIYIYDTNLAAKLAYGNVKCGVSASIDLKNKSFKNLSIVNNPKCKDAYLNLSDENTEVLTMDPLFLNLSEDKGHTDERGLKDVNMSSDIEERMNKLEDNFKSINEGFEKLTKTIEEKMQKPKSDDSKNESDSDSKKSENDSGKSNEDSNDSAGNSDEKTDKSTDDKSGNKDSQKDKDSDKPKKDEKNESSNKDPVVIDKSDNTEVVNAINKMGDKISEKVNNANPQSVAPTNPQVNSNMDDEVVNELVDKYNKIHPEK